jgi:hypothetical protein
MSRILIVTTLSSFVGLERPFWDRHISPRNPQVTQRREFILSLSSVPPKTYPGEKLYDFVTVGYDGLLVLRFENGNEQIHGSNNRRCWPSVRESKIFCRENSMTVTRFIPNRMTLYQYNPTKYLVK